MSNAMRLGKRSLAGVAAGALALGMLSIASAPAASAKPSIKPKAAVNAVSATVGPVRQSTTAGIQDAVYTSPLKFAAQGSGDDSRVDFDDTISLTLLTAPSNSARVWLDGAGIIVPVNATSADDSVTLANASFDDSFAPGGTGAFNLYRQGLASTDDTVAQTTVGVSEPGTYTGRIDIYMGTKARSATNIIESVTFSFTTVGKPTTMTLNPTSVALSASTSSVARSTVTLADASANITQPGAYDSVLITSGNTDIALTTPTSGTAIGALSFDDSALTTLGVPTVTITGNTAAGVTSVTAAPLGTLPSNGITTQTIAVTSGSTAAVSPRTLLVTAPTTQILDDTAAEDTANYLANVNLVRTLTVTGTGSTANAGVSATVTCAGTFTGLAVGGTTISSCGSPTTVIATANADGVSNWVGSWSTASTGSWIRVQVVGAGTGRVNKAVQVQLINPTPDPLSSPAGSIVQKSGDASTFAVSLTDNFGNPYVGYGVQGRATGTTATGAISTRVTTNASGEATISVPAPSATYAGAATMAFTVTSPGGATEASLAPASVTITYSATGAVTALSVAPVTAAASTVTNVSTAQPILPLITIPSTATGQVNATGSATGTPATFTAATVTAAGTPLAWTRITPTATPANAVTVTAPEGVKVSSLPPTVTTTFASGAQTALISSGGSVYVWATKTGTQSLTFTSGAISVTYQIRVANSSNDAYNIALSPATQNMAAGSFATATLKVTDAFGNPVDTTDDTGVVTITASGEIRLAGLASTQNVTTNAAGEAAVTLVAGTATGDGAIAATPASSNRATAWATGYTAPTGYPAPVRSAVAAVKVTSSPSVKSITIVGERTTLGGKPGIRVDGTAVGFATGDAVKPWIRFPGETSYSAGTARPTVSAVGDFTWQRKTGKKTYVYFSSADDVIKSNRVIIAAN